MDHGLGRVLLALAWADRLDAGNSREVRTVKLSDRRVIAMVAGWAFLSAVAYLFMQSRTTPKPLPPVEAETHTSAYLKNLWLASGVYGRAGCGDYSLAELTAKHATESEMDARLLAAVVAVESSCNSLAVSSSGAVGLMQVNVAVWAKQGNLDFSRTNLFNPDENMYVGRMILGVLVSKHGLTKGVEKYCGSGPEARVYARKVLALAAGAGR